MENSVERFAFGILKGTLECDLMRGDATSEDSLLVAQAVLDELSRIRPLVDTGRHVTDFDREVHRILKACRVDTMQREEKKES